MGGQAERAEEVRNRLAALALFEAIAAQFAPNPLVQALEFKPTGRVAVVVEPPNQEQVEFDDHLSQTNASIPTGDLPDFLLRPFDALGGDPELAVQQQPMAEELTFPDPSDG